MRPEELFFLQVQGSGVLVFEDGRRIKALYGATNGQPFAGIANPMRDRGLLMGGGSSEGGEAAGRLLALGADMIDTNGPAAMLAAVRELTAGTASR